MSWVLIDNISPNKPCLINLDRVDLVTWDKGTLTFEFGEGAVEVEAEKKEFLEVAGSLDIKWEIE